MVRNGLHMSLVFLVVALATSCVTLNITIQFPEAQVEEAAEKIESEVRGEAEEPGMESPSSWAPVWPIRVTLASRAAYAAEPNLDIETPEIRRIVESRKARWPNIVPLLDKGFVGEALDGTLKEVDPSVLSIRDLAQARQLVKAENKDRTDLYAEIAKANNLPASDVPKIAAKFAEVNRDKLKAGQYYEKKVDGKTEWVKK